MVVFMAGQGSSAQTDQNDPKRRIVDHLKRIEAASATELAKAFSVTGSAVRQQLDELASAGLVAASDPVSGGGRGRPAVRWALTPLARDLFPDRHADLTVDLIQAIREAVGEAGLDQVIAARSKRQRADYLESTMGTPVSVRASKLAAIRSAEGYLAEAIDHPDGSIVLVEHHCPICEAATSCQGLCRDELATFRSVFADVATVEREQHLLSGDQRCSYRIVPVSETASDA